ncbi:hypothetical protein AB0H88_20870 [Nonomuraea sp. NPDC050680]|uniref:VOC family protein n=1 Tax=Nonomuraea sp. NPDC050680 TaxID=3154630 RepID=UPI00340B84DD
MTQPFVFMDLRTADPGGSRRFYTELFGWRVADVPAGPATVIQDPNGATIALWESAAPGTTS